MACKNSKKAQPLGWAPHNCVRVKFIISGLIPPAWIKGMLLAILREVTGLKDARRSMTNQAGTIYR